MYKLFWAPGTAAMAPQAALERAVAEIFPRPAFQRMMQKQGIAWAENWPKA